MTLMVATAMPRAMAMEMAMRVKAKATVMTMTTACDDDDGELDEDGGSESNSDRSAVQRPRGDVFVCSTRVHSSSGNPRVPRSFYEQAP